MVLKIQDKQYSYQKQNVNNLIPDQINAKSLKSLLLNRFFVAER